MGAIELVGASSITFSSVACDSRVQFMYPAPLEVEADICPVEYFDQAGGYYPVDSGRTEWHGPVLIVTLDNVTLEWHDPDSDEKLTADLTSEFTVLTLSHMGQRSPK